MSAAPLPKADSGLLFSEREEGGLVLNRAGDVYPLNAAQAFVLQRLDGRTELWEIQEALRRERNEALELEEISEFVTIAAELGLLSLPQGSAEELRLAEDRCPGLLRELRSLGLPPGTSDPHVRAACERLTRCLEQRDVGGAVAAADQLTARVGAQEWTRFVIQRLDALRMPRLPHADEFLTVMVPVGNPDRLLCWLDGKLGWLFTPVGAVLVTALITAALLCVPALEPVPFEGLATLATFVPFLILSELQTLWHEASHGLACRHYGGPVRVFGVGLVTGMFVAFCDVTSSYLFKERWKRILVMAAGSVGDALFASILVFVCLLIGPGHPAYPALFALMAWVAVSALWNAIPFVKLDGYFALSDLFGIPNLRARAFQYARWRLLNLFAPGAPPPETTDFERKIFVWYAAATAVFSALLTLSIAQYLFPLVLRHGRGYGLALLLLVTARALLPLLVKAVVGPLRALHEHRDWVRRPRLVMAGTLFALLLAALVAVKQREVSLGRFTVRPSEHALLTAPELAEVRWVHVAPGGAVEPGALLVTLHSPALELELARAKAARDRAAAELAALERAQGAPALTVAQARAQLAAAATAVRNIELRARALEVTSPVRGTVAFESAALAPGQVLRTGEALLSVSAASLVADITPEWVPPQEPSFDASVLLVFPTGEAVRVHSAPLVTRVQEGRVSLRVPVTGASTARAGMEGRSRQWAAAVPLWRAWVWNPLTRFVNTRIWTLV